MNLHAPLMLALTIVGCGAASVPASLPFTVSSAEQVPTQIVAAAEGFAKDLVAGDYPTAHARFAPKVKQALSAEALQQVIEGQWERVEARLGVRLMAAGQPGFETRALLAFQTPRGPRYLKLDLDTQGAIVGINLLDLGPESACPTPPAPVGVEEIPLVAPAGAWAVPGTLTLPAGRGPFPAAVLVPGTGKSDRDGTTGCQRRRRQLALGLAQRGIASFRYDKVMSFHEFAGLDAVAVDDALVSIQLLAGRPEVDARRLFVVGHSQGGYVAPRIAQRRPGLAGLVILAGPTRDLTVTLRDQIAQAKSQPLSPEEQAQVSAIEAQLSQLDAADLTPRTPSSALPLGMSARYALSVRHYHPAEVAAGLTLPILILQGDKDIQVTAADLEGWRAHLGDRAEVRTYPRLNHLFVAVEGRSTGEAYDQGDFDPAVIADIAAWLGRQANAQP